MVQTNILRSQIAWLIEADRGKHRVIYNQEEIKKRKGKEEEDRSK